jgi:urease accessory protein
VGLPRQLRRSFGGGLVDGDSLCTDVELDSNATAFLSTQGPTRVYRSTRGCENRLHARIGAHAALAFVPDPTSLFEHSSLLQQNTFELAQGASLVYLDVLSCGRAARQERWAFRRYDASLVIRRGGALVVHDRLLLDPQAGSLAARLGRFDAIATLALVGPACPVAELIARVGAEPLERRARIVLSASPIGSDGLLIRAASGSLEALMKRLHGLIDFLPRLLGDDPLARRW